MSVTEETLEIIHNRLRELSNEATPEQLAYLAKAFETIASNGKMIDIVHLTDLKLDELLAKNQEYAEILESDKENYLEALDDKKSEITADILATTNRNANLINTLIDTRKPELVELVDQFNEVNDIPAGSSILQEIEKEGIKRKFVQEGSLPFLFGILSRGNDSYGIGEFSTELGKWAQEPERGNIMLQLLAGCHEYTTQYGAFYRPTALCFLQGVHGNFIVKEQYLKYASSSNMYQYPYAALGCLFIKNTTDEAIVSTLNFGGSSGWSSNYEGATVLIGTPDPENQSLLWQSAYASTTSSSSFSGLASFSVPAHTTIALILYTSSYYHTNVNGYYSQFIQWYVHSVRSQTLIEGLEIDEEMTMKAWQNKGLSTTYDLWRSE